MVEIELSPRDMEYLGILQEECAETTAVVSKIRRFGLYSSNPFIPNAPNNLDLLHTEVGDILALVELLKERGILTQELLDASVSNKLRKLPKFLRTEE